MLNIENLVGSAYNDKLTGSNANNVLIGGNGNDILFGGAGNDTLTGGAGIDNFVFNRSLSATTNKDVIIDFNVADDTIRLENSIMTGLGSTTGILPAGAFRKGIINNATEADDRIIYNTATGAVFYDADGTGTHAAIQIASIGTTVHAALTNGDFLII